MVSVDVKHHPYLLTVVRDVPFVDSIVGLLACRMVYAAAGCSGLVGLLLVIRTTPVGRVTWQVLFVGWVPKIEIRFV